MDTLTQATLGAAVGEAVLGRKIGHKAMLWGAICGTLPDLDLLVPFDGPVEVFTYHRSFSHSVFVLTLLTPLFVWLIRKLHPNAARHTGRWTCLVWLAFITHILLDCFTVYGTQVFWPAWNYPVGWASVFIIDPFYSVPLMAGVVLVLASSRETDRGHLACRVGLIVSTAYLAWSVGAKIFVEAAVRESLADRTVRYDKLLVSAGPFNTFIWRIVAMQPDGDYYEGYYSLFDGYDGVTLRSYESRRDLLDGIRDHWPVRRLQWFTKGFYKVWEQGESVVISDLRMGYEPDYVFSFIVGRQENPRVLPEAAGRIRPERNLERLAEVWRRIWSPDPGMD